MLGYVLPRMAKLKFLSGPLRGSEHDFDGELVIGRADADLDIDDPQISRRHLRLRCVSGAVLVEDLDSSNGTFLDNRRLTAVATVRSTAIIGIGQTKFELIGSEARVDATRLASPDPSRTRISDEPAATHERTGCNTAAATTTAGRATTATTACAGRRRPRRSAPTPRSRHLARGADPRRDCSRRPR